MSKSFTRRTLMPAVWIVAIATLAVVAVAGASLLRTKNSVSAKRGASAQTPVLSADQRNRLRANMDALPLGFEANQGQTDPQVKYMARGNGYTVFLTQNETVFALHSAGAASTSEVAGKLHGSSRMTHHAAEKETTAAISMKIVGGNPKPSITASSELPGKTNYFIGNDRSKWHQGVPQYAAVSYRDVYPGVNMAFHGQQKQLEFDFIVAPGANAAEIGMGVSGAKRIATDESGNLVLSSSAGDVLLHRPFAYQEKNGSREAVDARFVVQAKNRVSFELGNYDRSRELVIDPSVTYATYLGGTAEDDGYAIAIDGTGDAFVTGQTKSTNFPTKNALHGTNAGGFDVFVTELSPTGTLIYSTFVGGSGDDSGNAIAVDASGDVFVAGGTPSSNFPTQGAFQSSFGGGAGDAFVFELNPTGSALVYSTFVGGSGNDVATGLAVDNAGSAYIVGSTASTDFPKQNPIQSTLLGTSSGFVTKLNSSGNALAYSTYLGGQNADFAVGVALDGSKNAYVTGGTNSPNFPTTAGVVQTSCGTDGTCNGSLYDVFVTVINSAGNGYVYSTFLGGGLGEQGLGIAADSLGDAYVTGFTSSTDFPLKSPLQASFGGGTLPTDAFVTKLNPTGTSLIYSTYLGGGGDDTGVSIALDSNNNAYLTGKTGSTNFPTASATQSTNKGQNDAFVTEINAGGSALVFSTYLGGSLNENSAGGGVGAGTVGGIAVDQAGANIYVAGNTLSTDFPTVTPAQSSNKGLAEAFVAKYSTGVSSANFTVTNGALSATSGSPGVSATATITVTSTNGFNSPVQLACTVAPVVAKGPTCTFSNPSSGLVTPPANGSATATLNVATVAATAQLGSPANGRSSGMVYAMILPVFGISLLGIGMHSSGSRGKKLLGLLMLGTVLTGLLVMPACGGSSSNKGGNTGTPAGSYTFTVTGTSGGASATGTPALTLTVN